jgi:hypothetical protein
MQDHHDLDEEMYHEYHPVKWDAVNDVMYNRICDSDRKYSDGLEEATVDVGGEVQV